ncbi:MAG: hypothetical protein MUF00_03550 [Gemmatimonadaceae bacterium]|nr:hypothetical protein [Gemmatimonadaceae bacterium]
MRGIAVIALLLAWRESDRMADDVPQTRRVAGRDVRSAALGALRDAVHVVTDTALDDTTRALLVARRAAGGSVRWSGTIPATLATIDARPGPARMVTLAVAAASGDVLTVRDSIGRIDSVAVASPSSALIMSAPVGAVSVRIAPAPARADTVPTSAPLTTAARTVAQTLRVRMRDITPPRGVVVLARPGWEGKFVAAALEEAGWRVDVRFPLRPDTATVQGAPRRLDPSRVSVIVALDSTAAPLIGPITTFVRAGGGLVLGGEALGHPAFGILRPGVLGPRREPTTLVIDSAAPRRALPLLPVRRLTSNAVALERDQRDIALSARRFEGGRVVAVGVHDSWRWRMSGPAGSVDAHRRWWSDVVSAAHGEINPRGAPRVESFDAPLVSMIAALGPAERGPLGVSGDGPRPATPWRWIAVAITALLLEWATRRLRGAR